MTYSILTDEELENNRERDKTWFKNDVASMQEAGWVRPSELSTRKCCFTGQLSCNMECGDCQANPENFTEEKAEKWKNDSYEFVVPQCTGGK